MWATEKGGGKRSPPRDNSTVGCTARGRTRGRAFIQPRCRTSRVESGLWWLLPRPAPASDRRLDRLRGQPWGHRARFDFGQGRGASLRVIVGKALQVYYPPTNAMSGLRTTD